MRKSTLKNTAVPGCLRALTSPATRPMSIAASPGDCTVGSRHGKRTEQTGLFPLWPLWLVRLHCCWGSKLRMEGRASGHLESLCVTWKSCWWSSTSGLTPENKPSLAVSARSSYKAILSPINTKLQQCQSLLNAVDVPQTRQWVTLQRPGGWAWSFAQRGHEVPARSQLAARKQTSMTQSALVCSEAFQFQTNFPLHVTSTPRPKTRSGPWKERCKLRGKRKECALLAPLRL